MSRSLNKAMLIGHVGKDPETRTTQSGTRIATFSIATSRTYNEQERTDWHRCTAWGKLSDIIEQYVHKGDRLYIEGRIQYSTSEGQDGTKRYYTDIIVDQLVMLGSPGGAGSGGDRPARAAAPAAAPFDDDDDLPF